MFCDPVDLARIHDNPQEDIYIPCEFQFNGNVWHDVRLRLRGDSSRNYPKKSYKINFDKDERFGERDKINLNSEWLDPTFAKEFLAYSAFANVGLPSSRCWYTRLFINGDYFGLYLDVEQVDDISLDRMGFPEGATLYKAARDRSMLNLGEPVEELWEKETNTETGFYDLNDLIEWIHVTPSSNFYSDLGDVFDRPLLARHMALNAIICNSSTYYHNYYLVHDLSADGKWSIVPWDMDRSNFPWGSMYHQPFYYLTSSPALEEINPLIVRCWQDDQMRDEIFSHMAGMLDSLMTRQWYQETVDQLDTLLSDAIEEDPNKQFTLDDFHNAIRTIPARLEERGEYLVEANVETPLPFDLHPSFVRNDTLLLSWEPAKIANGAAIRYRVTVDTNKTFGTAQSFDAGTDTTLAVGGLPPGLWYWNVYAETDGWPATRSFRFFRTLTLPRATTRIDESFSGTTVLQVSDSPYLISGDIVVTEGAEVSIDPGVSLLFEDSSSLTINGTLRFDGTEADSVHIGAVNPEAPLRNEILIEGETASLTLTYTSIDPGITLRLNDGATLAIASTTVRSKGAFLTGNRAALDIQSSQFYSTGGDLIQLQGSSAHFSNVAALLTDASCRFLSYEGSNADSLALVDCEINQFAGSGIRLAGDPESVYVNRLFLHGSAGQTGLESALEVDSIRFWNLLVEGYETGLDLTGGSAHLDIRNGLLVYNGSALDADNAFHGRVEIKNVVFWANQRDWEIDQSQLHLGWCYVPEDSVDTGIFLVTGPTPGFVDGTNGLYYPSTNSPLIDSGYGIDIPIFDGAGNPRLDIGTVFNSGIGATNYIDIGLFENQAGFVPPPGTPPPVPGEGYPLFSYPNPFNSSTQILFDVDATSDVKLTIFNLLGRKVYGTTWKNRAAGRYHFTWSGRSSAGAELASGLYFVRLNQAGNQRTMRLLLVR
ncbi:CotH kinase family protein [bacterium]|nr:CotH kinase family protein [bacterium]